MRAPMEASLHALELILNYSFKDRKLLVEALTHPSYVDSNSSSNLPFAFNYERLEFLGDSALGHALSNHFFLAFPDLDQGQLSSIRAANVSTEKLARVAVRHDFYRFLRHNAASLDHKVKEFAKAVEKEDDPVAHGGIVRAPKVLADIVESVAGAVYVDVNFDLQELWVIFRGLLEPIVTVGDLQQQPQPVTMLFELCQKQGKQVNIKHKRKAEKSIASVYVDGKFVASSSSEQKETAKLNAVKGALHKLSKSIPAKDGWLDYLANAPFEIEGAKQKLFELCGKKKWPKPCYSIEKDMGPSHDKKFVCSVKIATVDGVLYMMGDEKTRIKEAENSAASLMIRSLQESNYL